MFTGLSAFPLTPMNERGIDEAALAALIKRLADAEVDSIGALGSTGSYAYLTRAERMRVAQIAVQQAEGIPVIIGIGALRTKDVLEFAEDAQRAGAKGVLLAPVSYQRLTDDEVFSLYAAVTRELSVPLCVYDNPSTTHVEFSDVLHARIAQLPNVASIKIPSLSANPAEAKARVDRLRGHIPSHVTIGISGDASAAIGLNSGCDAWYSVIAGLFPRPALAISLAANNGNHDEVTRLSHQLEPIWAFFRQYGSLRVAATIAEEFGWVKGPSLPLPLHSLDGEIRQRLMDVARLIS